MTRGRGPGSVRGGQHGRRDLGEVDLARLLAPTLEEVEDARHHVEGEQGGGAHAPQNHDAQAPAELRPLPLPELIAYLQPTGGAATPSPGWPALTESFRTAA